MKKLVDDSGTVITVRAHPADAVARIRKAGPSMRGRIAKAHAGPLLTEAERDVLLLAIAQKLGIL